MKGAVLRRPAARHAVRWALLLAALGGAAGAQDLTAYGRLASSLDQSVQARGSSAQASLAQLDAARQALSDLAPSLRNRQIVSGLQDALDSATAALQRTPAELQAQVLLARGLMRKALYDQSLTLLSSTPENSEAQLRVLAREFGLSSAEAQALGADSRAGRLERVAWRLQRSAVQKITAALASTRAEQSTAAYVNLARATSWFTVVQDASGAGELKLTQFGDALRQLTSGDTAGLTQSLGSLRRGMTAFSATLATPPVANAPQRPPAPQPNTPTPPADPTSSAPQPSATPAAQPNVAAGSEQGTGAVYAALGRALAAAGHADNALARAELAKASASLRGVPAKLGSVVGFAQFMRHVEGMQGRSALRPPDVQVLISELAGLEAVTQGQSASALDRTAGGVARGFGGWVRVVVFFLLGLACAVPLYLLNLAFGGRNRYWRAVTFGLALLMLPLMLEGLFGLLGAIGDASGAGALRAMQNLTLSQGIYALPVWVLVAGGALALLSFGFRGLCEQFGLLGNPSSTSALTQHTTTQTQLDWDEDV